MLQVIGHFSKVEAGNHSTRFALGDGEQITPLVRISAVRRSRSFTIFDRDKTRKCVEEQMPICQPGCKSALRCSGGWLHKTWLHSQAVRK